MSISSECSVSDSTKLPENNSMFSRTFSLMREHLKENIRPAGELNFVPAATPDLNLTPTDYTYQQSDLPQMDINNAITAEPDQNAQMTIFYAGMVYTFNDVPAHKANDIMFLASLGSSNTNPFPPNNLRYHNFPQPIDLPMKRKASLTRFFEKRKDRILARAPYTMTGESQGPSKLHDSKSWLSLA